MIIMMASILVTYWVFKGLKDAGVIDSAEKILVQSLEEIKGVAQNCTPKIVNLQDFWNCLSDPTSSRYVPTENDGQLQQDLQDLQKVPVIPAEPRKQ
jgi:hypothetical protein